jgi:hypothetical protein
MIDVFEEDVAPALDLEVVPRLLAFSFYEDLSIEENLLFVARLYDLKPRREIVARVPRRRAAGGLRHDQRARRRGEGRFFAARRALKPIDISLKLPKSAMALNERLLSTPLPAGGTVRQGANVELGDVVKVTRERGRVGGRLLARRCLRSSSSWRRRT